jgi:hypothetical protein
VNTTNAILKYGEWCRRRHRRVGPHGRASLDSGQDSLATGKTVLGSRQPIAEWAEHGEKAARIDEHFPGWADQLKEMSELDEEQLLGGFEGGTRSYLLSLSK